MRQKKELNVQIGEQVRQARERAKLTQEQLSEKIDVSPQYISDLERGVVGISIATLRRLCAVAGTTSDQILFGAAKQDRIEVLANVCDGLTEKQFEILTEIILKYKEAVQ